jgi:hypothetical protein
LAPATAGRCHDVTRSDTTGGNQGNERDYLAWVKTDFAPGCGVILAF